MENKQYKLRFLPIFEQDMIEAVDYIAGNLKNPAAAERLVDDIQNAIKKRQQCPLAFEAYPSMKQRKTKYYPIYVGSYIVFYVVIDDVMEVRRLIYSRRDMNQQI